MRALIQRVRSARVDVEGRCVGQIGPGLLVFLGVAPSDTQALAGRLAAKVSALRIFSDEAGKMNRSLLDTQGAALSVSQFTLYADTASGNRPSFTLAARPEQALELYHGFNAALRALGVTVEEGVFGADMRVSLVNDGPVTLLLDTEGWKT